MAPINTSNSYAVVQKQYSDTSELPGTAYTTWRAPYPSRFSESPKKLWLGRHESVIKGRELPGPLSAAQLDEFEEKGFLFLPNFIHGAALEELRQEIRKLMNQEEYLTRDFSITEPQGNEMRSLFAVHFLSNTLKKLSEDPRLTGAVKQILGGETYIHQSRINYKPGFAGKGFNWHSDFETWHAEDGMPAMHAVSASVIMTDNHEFNGPLMLVPGSHKVFVPCVGETPENNFRHSLKRQEVGVPGEQALTQLIEKGGIESVTGEAGGLILFDCNVLHASNANMSPDPRSNVFFVYNRRDNACQQPFAAPGPRPDFLAHHSDKSWSP